MEPKFLHFSEKVKLVEAVKSGNEKAEADLLFELQRLEGLVKDYQIVIEQATYKANSTHGKNPNLTYNQK